MRRDGPKTPAFVETNAPGIEVIVTSFTRAAALTDAGVSRSANQDAFLLRALGGGGLYAVADGMGGHAAGELASRLAVDALEDAYGRAHGPAPARLALAMQEANLAVYRAAVGSAAGMGTTLVALLLDGGAALIANVGDSRAYLWRRGELRALSRDHSWVAEQVRRGFLSEAEARDHSWRNIVSNALGGEECVCLDLLGVHLERGDRLLLCSDGLSGVVDDPELAEAFEREGDSNALLTALIDVANERGGPDNITAVVVDVTGSAPRPRYALPTLHQGGPVEFTSFRPPRRGGTLAYVALAVLYLTLLGMILLPESRVPIALIGGLALAATLLGTFAWRARARLAPLSRLRARRAASSEVTQSES